MTLIGRDRVLRELARSSARVTLLVGDSGVGKSTVLAAAQALRPDQLAPAPVQVREAPGALQLALLESLGSAAAMLIGEESTPERLLRLLAEATSRVADARLQGLASAVGQYVIGMIRARLGNELADAVQDISSQLKRSHEEELTHRISSASDKDVIEIAIGFAREVEMLSGGRDVLLALDDVDRLRDDDMHRLAELNDALTGRVYLRASLTTWNLELRDRADRVAARGATQVALQGLTGDQVRQWLDEAGIAAEYASEVLRVTAGYPLHISDAIALIQGGADIKTLGRLTPSEVLQRRTSIAWRQLAAPTRIAAANLAAMGDWISDSRARQLLALGQMEWAVLRRELIEGGLFVDRERPWFHELRRRHLWHSLLTDEERLAALRASLAEVRSHISQDGTTAEIVIQFARLIGEDRRIAEELDLADTAELSNAELALMASLAELTEQHAAHPFLDAEVVLLHAKSSFRCEGNLVGALRRASERGLIRVVSDDSITLVVPTLKSFELLCLLAGRAAIELGRLPVQGLAGAIFDVVIRPVLGDFEHAQYGIGSPSIATLAQMAQHLHGRTGGGRPLVDREPAMLLRGTLESTPFYGAITYRESSSVRAACSRFGDASRTLLGGLELAITDVISHPQVAVPSRRFLRAAELIVGQRIGASFGNISATDGVRDFDDVMKRRAGILSSVRSLSSPEERLAYELEEWQGYVYLSEENFEEYLVVHGRAGSFRLTEELETPLTSPYHRFEIAELAQLGAAERPGRLIARLGTLRSGSAAEELMDLHKRAGTYNRFQKRRRINVSEDGLAELLTVAVQRQLRDALELYPFLADTPPSGRSSLLLVQPDLSGVFAQGPYDWKCTCFDLEPSAGDALTVMVKIVDEPWDPSAVSWDEVADSVAERYGLTPSRARLTVSSFGSQLAEMLGHLQSELDLYA